MPPWTEWTTPAATFSEVSEPATARAAWTEYDARTGYNNMISELYQTTIESMDGVGIDRTIAQLTYTDPWTEF